MRVLCALVSIWVLSIGTEGVARAQVRHDLPEASSVADGVAMWETHGEFFGQEVLAYEGGPSFRSDLRLRRIEERRLSRRPAGWIIGGGMLGLAGLGSLIGTLYGFRQEVLGLKALAGLALVSGITAAVGWVIFTEGVKCAQTRRRYRLIHALSGTFLRW